ncbi:MAG: hypothetical protein PHX36_04980, partial [Mesotoga sp.]|uniref:hypothetical protein n=1 Tax=Mesotoga sp. TaxID=2053577 RepID=UPI00260C9C97
MGWHLDYSESSTSRHLDKTGRELRYELREEEKERSQSADAGHSDFAWPVSPLARPVPTTSD